MNFEILAQPKPLPLFMRACELLTREITSGHWHTGERLPTETELALQLGMAVGTVRKALAELVNRGLVERRQGSGTYVCQHRNAARSIYDFFRLELVRGGGLPTALVLDFRLMQHPPAVPQFGEARTKQCYRVRRLRSLNGVAVALEEIWFDARHRAGLKVTDLGEALYLFYKQSLGFWIDHVEDHVSVGQVPHWSPTAFPMQAGQVCATVDRRSWAGSGSIEEFSNTWFNPETARYSARWY
jgi:DNA-binding GntR family transcriptional regulator